MKDLISFVGRRIVRDRALSIPFDVSAATYSGPTVEEKDNDRESVERNAVYLQGPENGLRLARLISNGEGDV